MNNEPKRCTSFWRNLYVKIVNKVMAVKYKNGVNPYYTANKSMLKEYLKRAKPDGEICFLVAYPAIQGKGVGTKLLNELSKR